MAKRGRPKRVVELTTEQREELERWTRRATTAQALALRARVVLACAEGGEDVVVAERTGVCQTTIGKWRRRFIAKGMDGLLQSNKSFSVSATLRHGDVTRKVAFDDCYMEDKSFGLGAEGHAETVYSFTATRVREE